MFTVSPLAVANFISSAKLLYCITGVYPLNPSTISSISDCVIAGFFSLRSLEINL